MNDKPKWEPSEADLDVVDIGCPCGNSFTMPRDALFGLSDIFCGQCGKQGSCSVVSSKPKEPTTTQRN